MNKITGNYFKNMFLRKKKLLMLYTFICFMAYPFVLFTTILTEGVVNLRTLYSVSCVLFAAALVILGIFAFVLPIFTFKFSLTKRNVDTFFSLPINRSHLFKAHFIAPIIGVIVPLLANYLIGAFIMLLCGATIKAIFDLLILLIMAFVFFILIYGINTFFILHCNNVLDACVITGSLAILPIFVYFALHSFLYQQIVDTGMIVIPYDIPDVVLNILNPYSTLVWLVNLVHVDVDYFGQVSELVLDFSNYQFGYAIYYLVVGMLSIYGSFKIFKKKKGENAEQLTTSFITYPLFTNIAMVSFIILFNLIRADLTVAVLMIVVLFVIFVVVNGVAKRSMKLQKSTIISFVLILVITNGFNYISKQTEFFGLNRQVIDYREFSSIELRLVDYSHDKDMNETIYSIDVNNMSENDKEIMKYIEELQKDASKRFKENKEYSYYGSNNLNITYDKVGLDDDRYVWFDPTDEQAIEMLRLIKDARGE